MATHAPSVNAIAERAAWRGLPASEVFVVVLGTAMGLVMALVVTLPLDLGDGSGMILTTLTSMAIVFVLTPPLIRKMKEGGMVGFDVNKALKIEVAELGGIAALFAFSISLSVVVGLQKLLGDVAEPPFLAAISVFFVAAMIGLIDDISNLKQRHKAIAVAFAALPLMLVHSGLPVIDLPFGYKIDLSGNLHLLYWLVLVPIAVTGVGNAMNMSAGYNGLETGQVAIISLSLLAVGELRGVPDVSLLVFAALLGSCAALYYFNRFPARMFVGDIGTLGLGAALAAGVILAHVEFYGLVAITPAFFEAVATAYFGLKGANGERKRAYKNPIIEANGTLRAPPKAEHFTLAFWILSRRPMTEKGLVRVMLGLYALSGAAAVALSVL